MKHLIAMLITLAAFLVTLLRLAVGNDGPDFIESDDATPIPPITPRLVEKLAYAGASDRDIADRFLIDEAQLREQYARVLIPARAIRRMTIHGLQLDLARKLNGSMLIWLGRNELGQTTSPQEPDDQMPGTTD